MHSLSITPLITLPYFPLLICKWTLQFQFLNETLVYMQLEVWTLEHLKCLKQSFKIFKPEVLKATSFKRQNETVFQNICGTSWLSKMLFKNVCINQILNFVLFKFCCGMYTNVTFTTLLVSNVKEADSNSKSWSTSERQRANYNIISRSIHWNVFCKKGVLEISRKILITYLWLSSYFVNELWVWLILKFSLFFDSPKETSSDGTTFLNMRFITTQKQALFRENITC